MAAVSFKVKAVYDYASSHEDDLPFSVGQIITVTDTDDPEWYGGEYIDDNGEKQEGIFPRNFVEKFEPVAPPRPTRSRKKDPEPAAPPPPPTTNEAVDPPQDDQPEAEPIAATRAPPAHDPPPSIPVANPPEVAPVLAPAPIEQPDEPNEPGPSVIAPPPFRKPSSEQPRSGPPPVTQKPSSNAFKDRIAAFNKPAAPPVAPFKPGGLGPGSSFIKKPFVAPPPSRNAFVPPPRDVPTARVYRRDEDPEIKEVEAESRENAEKAGLVPGDAPEAEGDDQPKPTTLMERIALLQKQQAETAQRHANAAAKKEKPKRPPKKHTDTDETHEPVSHEDHDAVPPPLERRETNETASKKSVDEPRSSRQSLSIRRKSTGIVENDGNEADMSGAGDTTEGQEDFTEREDSDERHKPLSRAPTGTVPDQPPSEGEAEGEEDEEEEGEEEEEDPEVRRKAELRARMAKMSGGMGMAGMFGPPGAMPMGGSATKKPKPAAPTERRSLEQPESPTSPRITAPPVPTLMALPGMAKQRDTEEEESDSEEEQEVTEEVRTPVSASNETPMAGAPPPIPGGRPAPPPVPTEARPPPPPPPAAIVSPSIGSESDDELSENPPLATPRGETLPSSPTSRVPPPIPLASPPLPTRDDPPSPTSPQSKRHSRPPPLPPTQTRPPPPPPPSGGGLSRANTSELVTPMQPGPLDNGEEGEVTEYEGDYDTDIASSVPHKDALSKAHARDSSFDDTMSVGSGAAAPRAGPPPIPPPVPSQAPPSSRMSVDAPRAAPPPIPRPSMDAPPRDVPPPIPRASMDFPRAVPPPIPRASVEGRAPRAAPPPAPRGSTDAYQSPLPSLPSPKHPSYGYDDTEYDPFNHNFSLNVPPGTPPTAPPPSALQPALSSPRPSADAPSSSGTAAFSEPSRGGYALGEYLTFRLYDGTAKSGTLVYFNKIEGDNQSRSAHNILTDDVIKFRSAKFEVKGKLGGHKLLEVDDQVRLVTSWTKDKHNKVRLKDGKQKHDPLKEGVRLDDLKSGTVLVIRPGDNKRA
ncbi:hypothetical protein F5Y16DRAFT_376926 [Xylariaceae sp. FL0255]|nr:hypothetical protein F5Y16DRAFT_376926 [Xylariaceae sp. FL0255]